MIQVSPALNTSYIQQTSSNKENPKRASWKQVKINLGKDVTLFNHPHRAGGPCSPLKHTQSMEKAQASMKGHMLELPGKWNKGPGIIWDSVHWVHASSSSQDAGTYFTSLSSRQQQLHHTGWLRQHREELGNITNYSISKCYFSVANWRMSVPNLDQM